MEGHREDLRDVLARAPREALVEEAKSPRPLRRIHARAEEQRRVLAQEPPEDLRRRAGIGPGLGVAHRDLAAVGERSLEPRAFAALDDHDLVARLREIPGARGADHAGAENDDFHACSRIPKTDKGRSAELSRFSPCPLLLPGVGAEYREMA